MKIRSPWFAVVVGLFFSLTSQAGEQTFRAVSYNIWGLPKPLLQKKERLPKIAQYAPSLGADVIGFQETFTKDARILAKIADYPYIAWGNPVKGPKISDGLLIISKWPIIESSYRSFKGCKGTDCLSKKGVLHARLRVDGIGEVDVFNTHLNAAGDDELRAYQVQQMYEFIWEKSQNRPIIAMGDFNFTPDSIPYHEMVLMADMRDSHREYADAHPELDSYTRDGFTSDPRINPNNPRKNKPKRIDFIFFKDMPSQPLEIERSRLVFNAPVNGMFLSDHLGVMIDFKVRTQ